MSGADLSAVRRTGSPWIVRGETLEALRDAVTIRARAAADAEQAARHAAAASEQIRETARREGVLQGETEAARLLADAAAAAAAFRAAAEQELVPLAFAIAHQILGAFDEDERLGRAVRTALDDHAGVNGLRLRAHPATAAQLRAALDRDPRAQLVLVEPDEEAAPGGCTLIHPRGRAAIGPYEQLAALRTSAPGPAA